MLSDEIKKQYLATIGIETHVQFKTKSKLFSAEPNDARSAEPNTAVGHVSFGMPGALPYLNQKAVELAVKAAFALGVKPQRYSKFDRKHYFYPDLPKGYQISQFDEPIILGGFVEIEVDGQKKKIGITRAHLEEDAGKSSHPSSADYSLVDLNRAGTPLLEIVSEPDIHTPAEARTYAHELYLLMKYADVSETDLYHGNMRFDVNVSVSKDPQKLGTRSETKNLNSFRAVEKAVDYEINRQIELLEKGERIIQETRGWDEAKQKTFSQRSKEDAHEYHYMPEPDIPPIVLEDSFVDQIHKNMPPLPNVLRQKLRQLGIPTMQIEILIEDPRLAIFVTSFTVREVKTLANWLTIDVLRGVQDSLYSWEEVLDRKDQLSTLAKMVQNNELSSTAAKEVLHEVIKSAKDPKQVATEKNLRQLSDASAIEQIVDQVLADNPMAAEDVKNGEMKAIGFLVGQVMKLSRGQANPPLVQKIIRQKLDIKE